MIPLLLALACTPDPRDTAEAVDAGAGDTAPAGDSAAPADPDEAIRSIQPSTLPQGPEPCREPVLLRVTYVYDGDTFFAEPEGGGEEEKIRIIGLDTPELAYEDSPEECYGNEAGQYLSSRISDELVWLSFDYRCTDDYGRTLAYVHRGLSEEDFINRSLLRNGYAVSYFWDDGLTNTFDEVFAEDEAAAQAEGLGIWSACY